MAESYLAACAIFRNEAPYLAEWIDFHRLVGVEQFFLYDNGSDDESREVLAPYLAEGSVELRSWLVQFRLDAARLAYEDCLARVRGRVRWLTCIDLDEFLFAPREATLLSTLQQFEEFPGVVVRWQVYGSNGHVHASPEPVVARFTRRAPTEWIRNRRVKSIVDPERAERPLNTHQFLYRDGELAVDETATRIGFIPCPRFKRELRPLYRLLGPALRYFDPFASTDITSSRISVDRLRINHYPVKSRDEFARKARMKEGTGRYDSVDYFAYHDRNEVFDPILTRYVPHLKSVPTSLDVTESSARSAHEGGMSDEQERMRDGSR